MRDKIKKSNRIINVFAFFFCFYSVAEEFFLHTEDFFSDNWSFGKQVDWPSCEQLADTFCESLWSAENQGNFRFSDGSEILKGQRQKDVISNKEFIHLQKVAKSRCRLPEDVKAMAKIHCGDGDKKEDYLFQLGIVLSKVDSLEPNSKSAGPNSKSAANWKSAVQSIRFYFEDVINRVAYNRAVEENPHIPQRSWNNYTAKEQETLKKYSYALRSEIMDAVYSDDPDWKRAVEIFEEAKNDILTVVRQMGFDSELKDFIEWRLNQVEISLPYFAPGFNQIDCYKDSDKAKYYSLKNQVVLCIGGINTILSEGGLYSLIAHEVAHSIDPLSFLKHTFAQTEVHNNLKALRKSNSSLLCEDWERMKVEYIFPFYINQLPLEFVAIDECLVERGHLGELNPASLMYASTRLSEELMDYHASRNSFTYLTTPEILKDGVLQTNELYLNPRLFEGAVNHIINLSSFHEANLQDAFVFVQEYKCLLSEPGTSEEEAFLGAIKETKQLRTIYYYSKLDLFKRNARELIPFNLSKPSYEYFADWISYKAIEMKLKREPSLENRRVFVLSGISNYCKSSDLDKVAGTKRFIENSYSRALHPLRRHRILGHFTLENANLLHCERGEEIIKLDKNCNSFKYMPSIIDENTYFKSFFFQ